MDFSDPVQLQIWGGPGLCQYYSELFSTDNIVDSNWVKLKFVFSPEQEIDYLHLKSEFAKNYYNYPNGNVLVDLISHIYEIKRVEN